MSRKFDIESLVARATQRADLEGDEHVSTREWYALLSEIYGELYEAVAETGLRHFETVTTISANGAASYTVPEDHLGSVTVTYVATAGGAELELRELMSQEEGSYRGAGGQAFYYTLVADQLALYPRPASGTYRMRYIPQAPDYSDYYDPDAPPVISPDPIVVPDLDVVCAAGEAFVLWGTAAIGLAKGDDQQLMQRCVEQKEMARVRLVKWATQRAMTQPRRQIIQMDPGAENPQDLEGSWRFR